MDDIIYLDYNSTTPVDPLVKKSMLPYMDTYFGNPSSMHAVGAQTKKAIEKARGQVAGLLICQPENIIFTSGGTESNNMAIQGYCFAHREQGNHIIISQIEHPAVSEVCAFLEKQGFHISSLPVNEFGIVRPADLEEAITPQTILVSVMHANNETGSIQPIRELAEIAHKKKVAFHTDAAQSVGKISVDIQEMGVDLLSLAGHKLYAPKGVGALYIRQGIKLQKILFGADHENNLRPGTENILEIAGLGAACEMARQSLEKGEEQKRLKTLRDKLQKGILAKFPEARVNGHPDLRLPNTLNISFPGIEANTLLAAMPGIAASAGAACHTDKVEASSVISAMNVPAEYVRGTIRLSLGRFTTEHEVDRAVAILTDAVVSLNPGKAQTALPEEEKVKLTRFTHGLGCACKIRPQYLERILQELSVPDNPNLLVGNTQGDDATVYRINDETAIVQTVDFFTPVVDDPYDFGRIAAANSLSDIYAMGGEPLFALNIVGFPDNRLPESVLIQILKGAEEIAAKAGIPIAGGHTVEDTEPKFGMVVTGRVHPGKYWSNAGAKPGDKLILTKPLGTGILSTALKRGILNPGEEKLLTEMMATLNKGAAEIAAGFTVHACTDITGFGFLGHLMELASASGVTAEVSFSELQWLDKAIELATAGVVPGGSRNNLEYVSPKTLFPKQLGHTQKLLMADAQTSGGLLLSVPAGEASSLLDSLKRKGIPAFYAGNLVKLGEKQIIVES